MARGEGPLVTLSTCPRAHGAPKALRNYGKPKIPVFLMGGEDCMECSHAVIISTVEGYNVVEGGGSRFCGGEERAEMTDHVINRFEVFQCARTTALVRNAHLYATLIVDRRWSCTYCRSTCGKQILVEIILGRRARASGAFSTHSQGAADESRKLREWLPVLYG